MKSLKNYVEIFRNRKILGKEFYSYMALGIFAQMFIVALPKITEQIIHAIDVSKNEQELYFYLIMFGVSIVAFTVLNRLYHVKGDKVLHDIFVHQQIFYRSKFMDMDYKHIQGVGTGKGISKISQGIGSEAEIFYALCQILLQGIIKGSILFVIITILEPFLLVIVAGAVILMAIVNSIFYNKLKPITKRIHATYERNSRDIVRTIAEHLLIKVANKKQFELKRGRKNIANLPKDESMASFYQWSFFDILFMLIKFCEIVIYAYIGMMVLHGGQEISYLLLLTGYLFAFWWPIEESIINLSNINRHMIKYERLRDFISQKNDIVDGDKNFELKNGDIVFDNVSFGYDGDAEKNIKNCNLHIKSKQTTALIGHSGSGKSTLIKLLLRLYDVRKGKITIDGQNIRNIKISSLYEHIAYISQDPSVFDGSVRENLEYSLGEKLKVTDDILLEALKKAQADEFVNDMKNGLDTEIGEHGVFLSGGEKQRLALARIFLKNPKILILDEPTSALDSKSEYEVTKVLNKVMKNRTVIVIAHRLQTIREADKICVIKKGEIVEEGKYDELIKLGGIFTELVELQHGGIA